MFPVGNHPELGLQRVLWSLGSESPSPACLPHPALPTTARAPCLMIPTLLFSFCSPTSHSPCSSLSISLLVSP